MVEKYILLDSSILLECERIRIFEELKEYRWLGKLAITKQTFAELNLLAARRKRQARIALELLKRNGVEIVDSPGRDADESILNFDEAKLAAVATNDEKLIKDLKLRKIRIIRIRGRKTLELI
mgnify:CR=1 FL=1